MKKIVLISCLFLSLISMNRLQAQQAQYPIVKDFGGIYEIENSIDPDPEQHYKIVIDLKTLQPDKNKINPGLNNVARMMNLHGLGGVREGNLSVIVVVHGLATETILNDDGYRRKNGVDNPNISLIDVLEAAGAEVVVCGQSLLGRGFHQTEVNSEVEIALSMLTKVTELQHKGYHLLVFD
jgi:intracellular sulfur oxidation DsrE/DsrF family protein